eukprot:6163110-Lingulodinium_polyedra.AAC.1
MESAGWDGHPRHGLAHPPTRAQLLGGPATTAGLQGCMTQASGTASGGQAVQTLAHAAMADESTNVFEVESDDEKEDDDEDEKRLSAVCVRVLDALD